MQNLTVGYLEGFRVTLVASRWSDGQFGASQPLALLQTRLLLAGHQAGILPGATLRGGAVLLAPIP